MSNSANISAQTEDCGAVGGHAKSQIKSNIPHYKSNENRKIGNSKSEPTSSKFTGKRPAKGSDDPILTYNRYGSLDDMESEGNSSPKPKRK
jgi:hypothetical protein